MPDITVLIAFIHTVHDAFDGVDLIGAHHQNLPLGFHKHHVSADKTAKNRLLQHHIREFEQLGNLMVVRIGSVIHRQIVVRCIEVEMLIVVICEVHRIAATVADYEQLHEAHQRVGIAIATVFLIADNLFHRLHGGNTVTLQLYLHQGQTIDQDDDIVTLAAVCCVDGELVHHLIIILAPVPQVDETVIEGRAVVTNEGLLFAQAL